MNDRAQVITLMGAILAVSIIILAASSASLTNVGTVVPLERSYSLLPDFFEIKNEFVYALNRSIQGDAIYDDDAIEETFDEVKRKISRIEASHGRFFYAELIDIYPPQGYDPVRYILCKIVFSDGSTTISRRVEIPLYGE